MEHNRSQKGRSELGSNDHPINTIQYKRGWKDSIEEPFSLEWSSFYIWDCSGGNVGLIPFSGLSLGIWIILLLFEVSSFFKTPFLLCVLVGNYTGEALR